MSKVKKIDEVQRMVEAGVSVTLAVRSAMGISLAEFARRYHLNRTSLTNHVNGRVRPDERTIAALSHALSADPKVIWALLYRAAAPTPEEIARVRPAPPPTRATRQTAEAVGALG